MKNTIQCLKYEIKLENYVQENVSIMSITQKYTKPTLVQVH